MERASIPPAYHVALRKLAGEEVDYGQLGFREKDQFYTPGGDGAWVF